MISNSNSFDMECSKCYLNSVRALLETKIAAKQCTYIFRNPSRTMELDAGTYMWRRHVW